MRSGYLRKAAVAASRTTSPAKAPRAAVPESALKAPAIQPWVMAEPPAVEGLAVGPAAGGEIAPLAERAPLPAKTDVALTHREPTPVPLRALVQQMTSAVRSAQDAHPDAVREAPPELARIAPSAAKANAMSGVLQRLTRPATRIEAPRALRQMRSDFSTGEPAASRRAGAERLPAVADQDRYGVRPAAVGQAHGGEQTATNGRENPTDSHATDRHAHGAMAPVRAARPGADETVVSLPMPAAAREAHGMTDDKGRRGAETREAAGREFDRAGRGTAAREERGRERMAPAAAAAYEPGVRVPRGGADRVPQGDVDAAIASAATGLGQTKPERRVRIGQIDVHVNNQPANQAANQTSPRRATERSAGAPSAGLQSSQDLSRFLLRY